MTSIDYEKTYKEEPLVDINYVAWKLGLSVSTIRDMIKDSDWNNVPKPVRKIRRSYRWKRGEVRAFADGHDLNFTTLEKNEAPTDWQQFMD